MNEEERIKAATVRASLRTGRNAADNSAAFLAEAITRYFSEYRETLPDPNLPPDPRFQIQIPQDIRAQIAELPIDQLRRVVREGLDRGQFYQSYFDQVLEDTYIIDESNGRLQSDINDINIDPTSFDPLRQQLFNSVQAQLSPALLSPLIAERATKILSRSILTGASLRDTQAALADSFGGTMSGLVTLVSRDGLYGYDGATNDTIRATYDLDAYRYVGSIVADSRPHCKAWVHERDLTREYLEPRIDALHARGDPDGFRSQTRWDNFAQYRGGWNCRHQAIPVRAT